MRNYAGAPRAWHGPVWSKPAPLRLPFRNVRHPSVHCSLTTCFWKPTRKPRLLRRLPGVRCERLAERRFAPARYQEPPRRTRVEPDAGPVDPPPGCRGIGRLVPVCGPLPDIAVHIEKAPGVGRVLPHIPGLLINSTGTPVNWRGRS